MWSHFTLGSVTPLQLSPPHRFIIITCYLTKSRSLAASQNQDSEKLRFFWQHRLALLLSGSCSVSSPRLGNLGKVWVGILQHLGGNSSALGWESFRKESFNTLVGKTCLEDLQENMNKIYERANSKECLWEICWNILGKIEESLEQEVQENKPIFGQMYHYKVNLEVIGGTFITCF